MTYRRAIQKATRPGPGQGVLARKNRKKAPRGAGRGQGDLRASVGGARRSGKGYGEEQRASPGGRGRAGARSSTTMTGVRAGPGYGGYASHKATMQA